MATYIVPDDYATINAAVAAASYLTQDTIRVRVGTYAEDIDCRASAGGWLKPVIIEAYDSNNPPTITGGGGAQTIRADSVYNGSTSATLTLRYLIFSGCTSATNGIVYANSSGVRVENCTFTGTTQTCVWVYGSSTRPGYVKRSLFTGTTGRAIRFGGTPTVYASAQNCVVTRSAPTVGLIVGASTTEGLVYNCSLYVGASASGSWSAVLCRTATNVVIQTASSIVRGIECTTYTTCDAYGTFSTAAFTGSSGGGNLTSNPLYTAPGSNNLLPAVGSPLINAGTNLTSTFTDSYNGLTRPAVGAWTIGAYEVPATTTVSSVDVLSPTSLRLNLVGTVSSDSTWTTAGNYTITPSGGAAAVTVSAAVISTATTITLTTSEHTDGGSYNLAWSGLTNITSGNANYIGEGVAPTISAVTMTGAKTVRVTFSESMTNNAALTTTSNYTVTGATVSSVTRLSATQVAVTLAERIPLDATTIAVSGPQDLALNPCNDSDTFAVPYLTLVPPATQTGRTQLNVAFNVAPTSGYATPADWTVTNDGTHGVDVVVTDVAVADDVFITLTVHPEMTVGASYTIAAPDAANGSGPVG